MPDNTTISLAPNLSLVWQPVCAHMCRKDRMYIDESYLQSKISQIPDSDFSISIL